MRRILKNRVTTKVRTWMFWWWMEIDGRKPGVKYLTRLYVLNTPLFGIKLHWFHAPDPDEHCHDHPWAFLSLILKGGYTERREWFLRGVLMRQTVKTRGRGTLAFRRANAVHRIEHIQYGTMTLIVNGPVTRVWGFWSREHGMSFKFVPWRTYLGVPEVTEEV